MTKEETQHSTRQRVGRRVVLFPLPFQGHIRPMLRLGNALYSMGFSITVIHTHFNTPSPAAFPHFSFCFISDALPPGSDANDMNFQELFSRLHRNCATPFEECLAEVVADEEEEAVACLVFDPVWQFTTVVSDRFGLPRLALRTGGLTAFAVYASLPLLHQKGYFPIQEEKQEETVAEFPHLKVRDLPPETQHESLLNLITESKTSHGVICNTFDELEPDPLSKVRRDFSTPFFPIGPIYRHAPPSAALLDEHLPTLSWLNTQSPESVLYVSFGSVATITIDDLVEIAWGLAASKVPFLWVVRPSLVRGYPEEKDPPLPDGFMEIIGERGYIVKWAPQQEVLRHRAVGGFWSHCGWNSTVESMCEGVPVICTPFFADQMMNARMLSQVCGGGMVVEKGAKRGEIERAIRKVMVQEEGKVLREKAKEIKCKADGCLVEGGSSFEALRKLKDYILSFLSPL